MEPACPQRPSQRQLTILRNLANALAEPASGIPGRIVQIELTDPPAAAARLLSHWIVPTPLCEAARRNAESLMHAQALIRTAQLGLPSCRCEQSELMVLGSAYGLRGDRLLQKARQRIFCGYIGQAFFTRQLGLRTPAEHARTPPSLAGAMSDAFVEDLDRVHNFERRQWSETFPVLPLAAAFSHMMAVRAAAGHQLMGIYDYCLSPSFLFKWIGMSVLFELAVTQLWPQRCTSLGLVRFRTPVMV